MTIDDKDPVWMNETIRSKIKGKKHTPQKIYSEWKI